ncbi:MAG TPA: pyridoxine 5'-phosphate synthase [Gemmatimonadaceae bacterium]|nr:pyridoxine 5'-phosphate synthase [Gemmatimonadaceae bacterium]
MRARHQRLFVNIDHVATLRQARRGVEPIPAEAIPICLAAGADGITAHLREDRRHIQDADIDSIATSVRGQFNFEAACTDEMIAIALRVKPSQVTFVPEKREEITTEGGLDVARDPARITRAIKKLRDAGIRVSLFIDPDENSIKRSKEYGADAIELHTGSYANAGGSAPTLGALVNGSSLAAALGLAVHVGHGLNVANVGAVAAIPEVEELNIGHSIVSRAIFVGLTAAVREMREAMDTARERGERK